MKTKTKAVIVGALVTLFWWAIAFAVLISIYRGNLPGLLTGLAAFLCPFVGGYVATRMGQTDSLRPGGLAGLGAGLGVLLVATIVSRLAPNMTLASAALVTVGVVGGGTGSLMRYPITKTVFALAVVTVLVVLIVTACAPTTAKNAERATGAPTAARVAPPWQELQVDPAAGAGLGDPVSIEVTEFDRYATGHSPYSHRLTISDTETLAQLICALDADLDGGFRLECIPEYELHFHLDDGTKQAFGYSCGRASFIRGEQDFWQDKDFYPPEQFDALLQEQLALHPPEPTEAAINLVDEAGLDNAVELEVSLLHTRSYSQGDTTVAEISVEHLVTIADPAALGRLVASLDETLDLVPRVECDPEYVLRFKLDDATLHDVSYGCDKGEDPVLRGTLPFWRDMELRPPAEFVTLFEEHLGARAD